jgi:hypothetical protein
MGLDVDEARGDGEARGIDGFASGPFDGRSDRCNSPILDRDVGGHTRAAAAVEHKAAVDQDVMHGATLTGNPANSIDAQRRSRADSDSERRKKEWKKRKMPPQSAASGCFQSRSNGR